MSYWERCYYCKKLVRGGIQGIRGHLRGCPYIREVRTYTLDKTSYLVDAGPSILRFFDALFSRLHNTQEDSEFFLYVLEIFKRKKGGAVRFSYQVVPVKSDNEVQ